jgi:GGDEF domain-containing protein
MQASEIIERLAAGIAAILPSGDTPLTVSIGAAWAPEMAQTKEAFIAAADKALYQAKAAECGPHSADLPVQRANR